MNDLLLIHKTNSLFTSKEDFTQAREHVTNAAKSQSYLYPIKVLPDPPVLSSIQ